MLSLLSLTDLQAVEAMGLTGRIQITSVAIWKVGFPHPPTACICCMVDAGFHVHVICVPDRELMVQVLEYIGNPMSLNDVCCMVPAWFGVVATTFLALLAMECGGFAAAGTAAALVMSIIPAHIMRSVAGGYDNESVAVSAMCMTFFFWVRSLRTEKSWPIGIVAGICYIYMVMVWGGYIFVINMVGIHAVFLALTGSYSTNLYRHAPPSSRHLLLLLTRLLPLPGPTRCSTSSGRPEPRTCRWSAGRPSAAWSSSGPALSSSSSRSSLSLPPPSLPPSLPTMRCLDDEVCVCLEQLLELAEWLRRRKEVTNKQVHSPSTLNLDPSNLALHSESLHSRP
eukprot:1137919-Rhodomonas_salina.2